MFRRLSADKDSYITDRVIRNVRHTDANTGLASSLDLFKIYGVNKSGSVDLNELSRVLIHFDLNPLRAMTGSVLNIGHTSFKAIMSLKNVYGGQTTPSNFILTVHPLSKSWDEGIGRDVVFYNDIDSANFITSSFSNGSSSTWFISGANKEGLLGSDNIDIISSGNLNDGQGVRTLFFSQSFPVGNEDLSIDITPLVSATLVGTLPDQGFRIAFNTAQENDLHTRFVKRFAARHVSNQDIQPKLVIKYNDSTQDNQKNFYFDVSGSLFLYNYNYDGLSNLVSGSALTPVAGANSLLLHLITDKSGGLHRTTITASQHRIGNQFVQGMYSASFAFPSVNPDISYRLPLSSSIEFTQIWASLDNNVGYLTSSFKISRQPRGIASLTSRKLQMNVINVKKNYLTTDKVRFRLFAQDVDDDIVARRLPFERDSVILNNSYYSIRDVFSNEVIIPFETSSQATRLSTDGDGMYFDVWMSDLSVGRSYTIDILSRENEIDQLYREASPRFTVILE